MKTIKIVIILCLFFATVLSCQKGFLEVKPDQHLLVPKKLSDLQAILNNTIMNYGPGYHIISADDYQVYTTSALTALGSAVARNAYLWKKDLYENIATMGDWDRPYQQIFYTNVVLDELKNIERTAVNAPDYDNTKGYALFFRSMAFYQLAISFAAGYNKETAQQVPGIPLKLSSDINEQLKRHTLKETYAQILADLGIAKTLISNDVETQPVKPSRIAVDALLARIYLSMGDYESALSYSNKCILSKPMLLDFNVLSKTSTRPITFNQALSTEVIFWQWMNDYQFAASSSTSVAAEIVTSYNANDLRKTIFLRDRNNGVFTFKGNYTGDSFIFTGLATDEMYLIRAECYARDGKVTEAMRDLNSLMLKRWNNTVSYPEITAANTEEALTKILAERRKELITRGTRWADLKRLNQETRYAVTLKRVLDGVEYALPPNDARYVFPFPQTEIDRNGFPQNGR